MRKREMIDMIFELQNKYSRMYRKLESPVCDPSAVSNLIESNRLKLTEQIDDLYYRINSLERFLGIHYIPNEEYLTYGEYIKKYRIPIFSILHEIKKPIKVCGECKQEIKSEQK